MRSSVFFAARIMRTLPHYHAKMPDSKANLDRNNYYAVCRWNDRCHWSEKRECTTRVRFLAATDSVPSETDVAFALKCYSV